MDFADTPEHEMLRAAVRDIGASFGHEYFAEKARSGGRTDELWKAVGDLGFLGVHLPEEYGGGGGGMYERALVSAEPPAPGGPPLLFLLSPPTCGGLTFPLCPPGQTQRRL